MPGVEHAIWGISVRSLARSEELFELNAQSGTTLVLVTHDERLAARCSRVLRLAGGRLVEGGGA